MTNKTTGQLMTKDIANGVYKQKRKGINKQGNNNYSITIFSQVEALIQTGVCSSYF